MIISKEDLCLLAAGTRRLTLASIFNARSGHPGGSLSCADLLTFLTAVVLDWRHIKTDRDRIVLSKGHAVPALYSIAAQLGVLELAQLSGLRKLGNKTQGHPHVVALPWVRSSTGSLGQGFSAAIGIAMGHLYRNDQIRIYAILGDGELQEGMVWEGAMCAAHYRLHNLCAIVDYNKMQSDDLNENIMGLEPLRAKWEAFNWHVIEIDGHDFDQIESAFEQANETKGKPTVIIAHTIKGKGVSFMEGQPAWHGSVTLRPEELEHALRDLGTPEEDIPAYLNGSIWSRQV